MEHRLTSALEARFRYIWKADIQAALRGHLVESHSN
jgi:hypothetical protein